MNPDVVAVINAGAKDDDGVSTVTRAALPAVTTTALLYLSDVDRVQSGYAGVEAAGAVVLESRSRRTGLVRPVRRRA